MTSPRQWKQRPWKLGCSRKPASWRDRRRGQGGGNDFCRGKSSIDGAERGSSVFSRKPSQWQYWKPQCKWLCLFLQNTSCRSRLVGGKRGWWDRDEIPYAWNPSMKTFVISWWLYKRKEKKYRFPHHTSQMKVLMLYLNNWQKATEDQSHENG